MQFTSITMSVSGVSASDYTFGALAGSERVATTRLDFADGTRYDDIAAISWVTLSSFVTFESDYDSAISAAAATGLFTLNNNSATRTTLTARSVCDSSLTSSV